MLNDLQTRAASALDIALSSLELWLYYRSDFQIEGRAFPITKRTKGMSEETMRTILGASWSSQRGMADIGWPGEQREAAISLLRLFPSLRPFRFTIILEEKWISGCAEDYGCVVVWEGCMRPQRVCKNNIRRATASKELDTHQDLQKESSDAARPLSTKLEKRRTIYSFFHSVRSDDRHKQ